MVDFSRKIEPDAHSPKATFHHRRIRRPQPRTGLPKCHAERLGHLGNPGGPLCADIEVGSQDTRRAHGGIGLTNQHLPRVPPDHSSRARAWLGHDVKRARALTLFWRSRARACAARSPGLLRGARARRRGRASIPARRALRFASDARHRLASRRCPVAASRSRSSSASRAQLSSKPARYIAHPMMNTGRRARTERRIAWASARTRGIAARDSWA